jgi:hypothetical protein
MIAVPILPTIRSVVVGAPAYFVGRKRRGIHRSPARPDGPGNVASHLFSVQLPGLRRGIPWELMVRR